MIHVMHVVDLPCENPWLNGVAKFHDASAFRHSVVSLSDCPGGQPVADPLTIICGVRRFTRRMWSTARILENWREVMKAARRNVPVNELRLRNGVVLAAPKEVDLAYLFYETWVSGFYSDLGYNIRNGDVVVDIGANIGVFAIYAATRGHDVRVYAYEPFPDNASWMRKNITGSGIDNIRLCEQAVAGAAGKRFLQVDAAWIKHHLSLEASPIENGVPVDCVTLDQVFQMNNIERCSLLKLDCEGSELEILKNASDDVIRRVSRIVGEQHYDDNTAQVGEFRELLERRGFAIDKFESAHAGGQFCARRK